MSNESRSEEVKSEDWRRGQKMLHLRSTDAETGKRVNAERETKLMGVDVKQTADLPLRLLTSSVALAGSVPLSLQEIDLEPQDLWQ